jgi:hypothetical protein
MLLGSFCIYRHMLSRCVCLQWGLILCEFLVLFLVNVQMIGFEC